jgi:hypothetical protein
VFGVKESLVVDCDLVETREEAAKYHVEAPFYRMHYDFVLKPAQARGLVEGVGTLDDAAA